MITGKLISICYAMLRNNHKPWNIMFELSNSTHDGNFGAVFSLGFFNENVPKKDIKEDMIFSDWGHTPEEALEKVAHKIANGKYDGYEEPIEPAG